jgi:histone H3/H4
MMKQTISQLSLKRLCHRVGIKRISIDCYKPLYQCMISILVDLADKIKIVSKSMKTKIITEKEIEEARMILPLIENRIQQGGKSVDYPGFCAGMESQCSNMPEIGQSTTPGAIIEDSCAGIPGVMNGGGGSKSGKEEYYFTIPLTQFERFLRQHLPHRCTFEFSDDGMDRLQYHIENMTMQYLAERNKQLQDQDIKLFFL